MTSPASQLLTTERQPFLVLGLPEPRKSRVDWRVSLTNIVRRQWGLRKPSPNTIQAETGLGIDGTPYYFFAMHTERAFGFAVFFFQARRKSAWQDEVNGATPFDSGGLWHDNLRTTRPINDHQKRKIFRTNQYSLSTWVREFNRYIHNNYNSINKYIYGERPSIGVAPIIPKPPNTSRAWTWEVRVPINLMYTGMELMYGFMSEEDGERYRDWLWNDSEFDDGVCHSIELWMESNVTFTQLGVPALAEARRVLLGIDGQ